MKATKNAAIAALEVAIEAEMEWQARARDGAIDPEWNYETMVGNKRRAALALAAKVRQ